MKCEFQAASVKTAAEWTSLRTDLDPAHQSPITDSLLRTFRAAGARFIIEETAYLDRDFSAAYASFYSTLYQPYLKYCRRIHFFSVSLSRGWEIEDPQELGDYLERTGRGAYLGYIVLRPLRHAPVSSAVVSAHHIEAAGVEVSVRSCYKVHLLGAELPVDGVPVTEQDTRTGACAQATIWSAGRHLHNRHSMPWFSMPDITDAALKPTDSVLTRSLPAGSDYLTADNMVRALRAMGEHPIVYGPEGDGERWAEDPERIISRYLDSGIPVIVGLEREEDGVGHAVVAVGAVRTEPVFGRNAHEPTAASSITHFLVNDDQRGVYQRLPITKSTRRRGGRSSYEYSVREHANFIMIPLPNKVFMKAEIAETLARDKVRQVASARAEHIRQALGDDGLEKWEVDPGFYALPTEKLVARTYLTYGWKYKHRVIRNTVPDALKEELTEVHLPRYVWVVEFSVPEEAVDLNPCGRRVRAHVVLDATGSRFGESVIATHIPGIIILQAFDPNDPRRDVDTIVRVLTEDRPYYPKVRGWRDFAACSAAQPRAGQQQS